MTAYQNILICLTTFATTLLANCISCETNEDCELPCPLDTEAICVTIPYVDIQCCECRRDSLDVDVDVDASNWCRSCSTDNDCGSGCRCETLGSAFGIDVKECRGTCCTNPDIDLAESPWCTSCSEDNDCGSGCECETLGSAFGIDVKECRGSCCTNPDIDLAESPWCTSCSVNDDCETGCECVTLGNAFGIEVKECRGSCCTNPDIDFAETPWCTSCSVDNDCGSGCECDIVGSAFGIDVKECRGTCCTNPDIDLAESPWCTSCSIDNDCGSGCECVTLGNAFGIEVKECRGTCCTNPDIDFAETPWCTSCSVDNDCGSGCECETLGSAFGIEVKECRGSCCINPDFAHQSSGYEMKNEIEITAVATLRVSESGVDGTVTVDENGNVFINLNLGDFDNKDSCDSASYYIYTEYEYDLVSTNSDKCTDDIIGDMYNPFNTQSCSEYNGNGDKYFDCSIGDLSGRFGAAWINGATSVSINGNISEDNDDKEGGFCGSRLTPEALYKRSVVFKCNDEKENILFCAPFEINMNGGTGNCKELGEICEGTGDCCDSECFGFPGKDKKCCREIGESCETREDCCDSECVDIGGNGRKECYLE